MKQFLLLAGMCYTISGIGLFFSFFVGVDGDGASVFLPPIVFNDKVPIGDFPDIAFQALILGLLFLFFRFLIIWTEKNRSSN